MANFNPTVRPTAAIEVGTSPKIYNPSLTADVEYTQTLTADTKKLIIKPRTPAVFKIAYVSGDTSTLWLTIPINCVYSEQDIRINGPIYIKADRNVIMEILEWS